MSILCHWLSSSSIDDRLEALLTTALRRRVVPVSTVTKTVRTLDPARGSSTTCAPSISSSSSTGNRGLDLRRRSVTTLVYRRLVRTSPRRPFYHVRLWIGFAHLSVAGGSDIQGCGRSVGYACVELRLGVVDALLHLPFPAVVDASASAADAPGSRGVGRYDGDGVVLVVDSCRRVELYMSADDGIFGIAVGLVLRIQSV